MKKKRCSLSDLKDPLFWIYFPILIISIGIISLDFLKVIELSFLTSSALSGIIALNQLTWNIKSKTKRTKNVELVNWIFFYAFFAMSIIYLTLSLLEQIVFNC